MSDETWLVSELVSAIPEGEVWPGSVVRWCSLCAEAIWLSREAIAKLESDEHMTPMCAACAVPLMQDTKRGGGEVKVHKVDPKGVPLRPVLDYIRERYGR